jgi:hypothetical protein
MVEPIWAVAAEVRTSLRASTGIYAERRRSTGAEREADENDRDGETAVDDRHARSKCV